VRDEYFGRDQALADYGVVITEKLEVDDEATRRRRQTLRGNN
jgi:hypothetical protein